MTREPRPAAGWVPVALRAGYGLVLLVAPDRILEVGAGTAPGWAVPTARVLGGRHLVQAAVLALRPQLAGPGALVDLAHAATDLLCAAVRPDLRTPPLLDALVASGLAGLTVR